MAARPLAPLDTWSRRTAHAAEIDLVFAHPRSGLPLDGSKVTKRFKPACRDAGVRPCASTTCATPSARASPLRASRSAPSRTSSATPDSKTTEIYARYAPRVREVEMVNHAFALGVHGTIHRTGEGKPEHTGQKALLTV